MCDGATLLPKLQEQLNQPKELRCTGDYDCWCNKVSLRIRHNKDDCMSPQEILDQTSVYISDEDKKYLRLLTDLTFIGLNDD